MNPELFMNQYMTPMYISTSNMITPIAHISLASIHGFAGICYNAVVNFNNFAWQTTSVFVYTFVFMVKEAISAVDENLSFAEKILLCVSLYNLIALFVNEIDKMHQNNRMQDKLEKMEKQVKFLKKTVTIREHSTHIWSEEIKAIRNENIAKIEFLEKELSNCKEKLEEQSDIINEHQRNEQKIFQKLSQANKELRKMKKEMENYA
jgi:hypothetical protein